MQQHQDLIHRFYTAFQQKDYKTMQECYSDKAVFNDEVFVNLNAMEVRAMWEMLIKQGKDLQLEYSNVTADQQSGTAEWVATYTFSKTGRKVVNRIKARFTFEDGKILTHTDHFNFWRWSRQALGLPGLLLGWTTFLQKKVQATAGGRLAKYMSKQA